MTDEQDQAQGQEEKPSRFPSAAEIGGAKPPDPPGTEQPNDVGSIVRRIGASLILPAVAILLALAVGAIVIWVSEVVVAGGDFELFAPLEAYAALFRGAFGSFNAIVNTLVFTTPLLLAGLGVGLAFRAGLFNIGANGQFLMGALAAVAVGVAVKDLPSVVAIPLALLAGISAGAFWGFIPGHPQGDLRRA